MLVREPCGWPPQSCRSTPADQGRVDARTGPGPPELGNGPVIHLVRSAALDHHTQEWFGAAWPAPAPAEAGIEASPAPLPGVNGFTLLPVLAAFPGRVTMTLTDRWGRERKLLVHPLQQGPAPGMDQAGHLAGCEQAMRRSCVAQRKDVFRNCFTAQGRNRWPPWRRGHAGRRRGAIE